MYYSVEELCRGMIVAELPGCLELLLVATVEEKTEQQKLVSVYINTFARPGITSLAPGLTNPTPKPTAGLTKLPAGVTKLTAGLIKLTAGLSKLTAGLIKLTAGLTTRIAGLTTLTGSLIIKLTAGLIKPLARLTVTTLTLVTPRVNFLDCLCNRAIANFNSLKAKIWAFAEATSLIVSPRVLRIHLFLPPDLSLALCGLLT